MPSPDAPISITMKSGEQVKVNDHVYCSPSWSVRDGTPYSIARIMEFLPPPGMPTFDTNGKRNGPLTRVRLAWYYRPGDVSDRNVADSRLLLAAIYSEVCDLSQLRAKCHVIHRDKISDLAGWKKRPDRFYFTRLFDPWIRKEFEVIQATSVRNLPEHIRDVLVSRYEYVVAEKEIVPDLTDDVRLCATCDKWCPPPETVQCDRCKNFFHMACVTPPLLAKPSRGYGWTCAPCSRQHEEEVDSHETRSAALLAAAAGKPKSNAPAPRARGRPRKDRSLADKEESVEIKHFNMWPFRYFGQYTVAEDTLNPDDLIFPRAATRVGPKYQVGSLPIPGTDANGASSSGEERGGDTSVEVLCSIQDMTPEEMAAMETYNRTLTNNKQLSHNVDWLSESIRRFSEAWASRRDLATVNMQSPVRIDKWKKAEIRYMDRDWTELEKAAFEDAILTHGAELRPVREEVETRTMYEVVRYYGHWKNSKLGEENRRIKAARQSGLSLPIRPPSRTVSDDGDSVVSELTKSQQGGCSSCRTRESSMWWKAPKAVHPNGVLCDNCGISWRKYGELNARPIREEIPQKPLKPVDKREGTPLSAPVAKRQRTTSLRSTPPVAAPVPAQIRCLACHKQGPPGKVLKCRQCSFRLHAGVCGIGSDPAAIDGWTCDLCLNETTQDASVVKASRKDTATVVDFKDASGCMVPTVTCKGHPPHRRETLGMCDTNEHNETALQVYCTNYKQVPISNAHGLLRKARRLDSIINAEEESNDSDSTLSGPDPKCDRCGTEFSPTFYPASPLSSSSSSSTSKWMCHKCHWGNQKTAGAAMLNGNTNGNGIHEDDAGSEDTPEWMSSSHFQDEEDEDDAMEVE
ncbi:hypothetical protein EUX98_g4095 [Antrodiella citrinella]|uniref:Uncharacterized protein n=1 Tax=Antrodiella citrinella TaxID=2447956 RepID=A0A4S4MXD3_9APHY|nr:hypothetical protein EUX98_g4095 [Antrodiella citrinella]